MGARVRPSLRRPSAFSAVWWPTVLVGWGLTGLGLWQVCTATPEQAGPPLLTAALMLVVLELLPLVQGRGHDPQGVVMSTAFVFGILFLWGLWPAIVMVSAASVAADLRARKSWDRWLFNPAQYTLSVASGWLVMLAFGYHPSLDHQLAPLDVDDIGWVVGAWLAYFVVNLVLVSLARAWRTSFREELRDDFWHNVVMSFAVFALSPLVVVVAQNAWLLLPLLLIPLVLLYNTAQISLAKEHEASHDALTGLPNRANLQFSLGETLCRARRDGEPFGLLLIDLDRFKEVNDTLGHAAGDELLIKFADRLKHSVRPTDDVARLGGDEFAVIIPHATEPQVRAVAERIREALFDPVELGGLLVEVEASVGVAMYPDHAERAEDLLRFADVAMYMAKQSHAGVVTYSSDRDHNSANRLGLIGELRQALEEDALELHYQPKVSMADSSLIGVEALIRWHHPERGYVPPDAFIPLAERSGIMHLLTERVVRLAARQMAEWRDEGLLVPVAINVAPSDLAGHRLLQLVAHCLAEYDVPPGMLRLEITERMVADEMAEFAAVMLQLRDMGVTLSLDDFGTGYSSLLRLQSLPVDEIKIDRSFVSDVGQSDAGIGIVRAVVDLAHALGIPAIAEGVETEHESDVLRALGCDGAQGWFIARPMPAAQATAWLRAMQRIAA